MHTSKDELGVIRKKDGLKSTEHTVHSDLRGNPRCGEKTTTPFTTEPKVY